jgi:predicted TIM-barrel enzyme
MPRIDLKVFKQHDMFAALNTSINYNKTIAGILLGEDLAFQAKEAGSNPTTRSKAFLAQLVERRPYKA